MKWERAKYTRAAVAALRDFIEERESIRRKKEAGIAPPWSKIPAFVHFHWCNCRREDDRVTRWLARHWREPHAQDPDLWFALLVARRATNHPATMAELGYPVPWDPKQFLTVFAERASRGEKVYHTPAYRLTLRTKQKGSIAAQLERSVLTPMWEAREYFRPRPGDSLATVHERLAGAKYLGGFYPGQIVADLKHVQLRDAPDWLDFAVPGPGSVRGINRVFGLPPNYGNPEGCASWSSARRDLWHSRTMELRTTLHLDDWELQDVQATLCEFDKFERLLEPDGHYVRRYRNRSRP